ncbi:formylmethanofuran dehydrogenase subunit B [Anatilimnocola aggregata]|nr:formylmethanofuran dehydrogenase subunit B [Anatilimnocola aggregata]
MVPTPATASELPNIVPDVTCTACGCLCDDIELTIEGQRITAAKQACALGKSRFLSFRNEPRPTCFLQGQPATLAAGIERAAQLLTAAKYPLVFGLTETTIAAQRAAVAIADWLGAVVDATAGDYHGASGLAFPKVGESTCSLGEVKNRGDLILFWGTDPAESHPRHFERYSLQPAGLFVPRGRADRTCVVIDVRQNKTAEQADQLIAVKPGSDFEAIWTLRALLAGIEVDPEQVATTTGQSLDVWKQLLAQLKRAKYGVIFFGAGITQTRGQHANGDALRALTRDLNRHTRFVCRLNRAECNSSGADNVAAWQTGYALGVNLAQGYPRFSPGEYTAAAVLTRQEADAALIVSGNPLAQLPSPAKAHLATIPLIALHSQFNSTTPAADVVFNVATSGIEIPGTMYRFDDVPVPLHSVFTATQPSDHEVLLAIEQRVKELKKSK